MDQFAFDFDVSFPHNPPTPECRVKPGRRPRPATASRSFATPPLTEIVPVAAEAVPATVAPVPAKQVATTTTPSTAVPAAETNRLPATIAEVMARLPTLDDLSSRRCRDMLSALRKVCRATGRRPEEVPATATSLRTIFANTSPAVARVSKGRWDNLRCLSLDALHRVGLPALQNRAHQPLSIAWEALRDRLPDVKFRAGLARFMG